MGKRKTGSKLVKKKVSLDLQQPELLLLSTTD